jgi:hypothetical protein
LSQRLAVQLINSAATAFAPDSRPIQGPMPAPTFNTTPGGRPKSGGQMPVTIINNSGTPLSGSASTSQDEAGNMIMSVVLDRVNRNVGGSRDLLKGAMA